MAVGISNILALLGGVALFLFGMGLMGDSLKLVAGQRLELILYRLSNTPLKGVLLGTAVTAVIQSSSATSAMVVGFVNSGMMKLSQAIGIVLGANIGTSVTGWILCLSYISSSDALSLLSSATIPAIAAIAGILLRMRENVAEAAHRRYPARLCRFDVRHERDERRGVPAARERGLSPSDDDV